MHLDVVIPTYNRSGSLERAIRSLLAAPVPAPHTVRILPVDNRSGDDTRQVIERLAVDSRWPIVYLTEFDHQGRSHALNQGIRHATGDLIAFIDDDEEIDPHWYQVLFGQFADPAIDYIGGPYRPRWASPPPAWLNHPHTRTAIGWAEFGDRPRAYADPGYDALLMGGNAVLRRACLDRVGPYDTTLGRSGTRLLAGEDAEMHDRLIAAGLNGWYRPELIVDHHIPAQRLTRGYMRRWAFWASASEGYRLRSASSMGAQLLGLPRYLFGRAAQAPLRWTKASGQADRFHCELSLWRFAGIFYGRHFLSIK